ncbi:hypothetical protein DFH07DRAFT_730171, partial [Mycena maculata]
AALAEEARMMLSMLPWGIPKPVGLSDSEPFHTLWHFLGTHWLTGSQMNDMLEILRYKINTNPALMKNRVWGTVLVPKILEAHRAAVTNTYWTAQHLGWLRDLGDDIMQSGAALITSTHLGEITDEPHWVTLIFDMTQPNGVIRYGDSFGTPIPETLLAACHWWMGQHTATNVGLEDLPIATQQDGFSCGLLVDNSQQHFVDSSIPLTDSAEFVNSRLEAFNKISARGLEQVPATLLLHIILLTSMMT